MAIDNDVRRAHDLLDNMCRGYQLNVEELEHLRNLLPELPKQKTVEELTKHVFNAWASSCGDEWGGGGYGSEITLEHWLAELRRQLKGLENEDKPIHPEFLETEGDYCAAPEGTVVSAPGRLPWVKEGGRDWSCSGGTNSDNAMAKSGRRSVLRWGWGK